MTLSRSEFASHHQKRPHFLVRFAQARREHAHEGPQEVVGEVFVHESFIGSQFKGTIEEEVMVGSKHAIVPGIEGWAHVYGANQITIDDSDPYAFGFQVV